MAQPCPYCEQPLDDDVAATECPHCGASLLPEDVERYGGPIRLLRDVTGRLLRREIPLTAERVEGLFSHITGTMHQMLDTAAEDLQKNFKELHKRRAEVEALPEEARRDVFEFLQQFEAIQSQIQNALNVFGDVLRKGARDPKEFEAQQFQFDFVLSSVQDAIERLEVLNHETSDPLLANLPDEPLADDALLGLDAMQKALGAISDYIETRDGAKVDEVLKQIDAARSRFASLRESIQLAAQ